MAVVARALNVWIPLAVAVTGLCLLQYVALQQNYRQSLNDPQIQIAEDAARALAVSGRPAEVVPPGLIDISTSLSPWIGVYTKDFQSLETNAVIGGRPPVIPQGAFEAARDNTGKDSDQPHENRVTWQASDGTRQAIVVVAVPLSQTTYYVVSGRNMREVENRESRLGAFTCAAWIVTLLATLAAALAAVFFDSRVTRA